MASNAHYALRDTRDHLIDLLGFGNTYPLQDLPVPDKKLTVPFDTPAKVSIEHSQPGVLYQLHFDGQVVEKTVNGEFGEGAPVQSHGNGGTLILETPRIEEDITFRIFARKQNRLQLAAYLHQTANIKVGLDKTLNAKILNLPFLDTTQLNPPSTAARIAFYGTEVEVNIEFSQEGVEYELVYFEDEVETSVSGKVVGDLNDIVLTSQAIFEDIDIRIRATKTFADGREPRTALLDVILPLRIRANPAIAVTMPSGQIIDYNEEATLVLEQSQKTAEYQLYLRTLPDADIHHQPVAETSYLQVAVPDEPDVSILSPPKESVWTLHDGFIPIGTVQAGTGNDLQFTLPTLTHESVIIVQAQKHHKTTADPNNQQTIASAIQLAQSIAILVRPNSAQPIRLKTEIIGTTPGNSLEVMDGQLGVFYHFQTVPDNTEIGSPAYFHKHDGQDEAQNKGIGQLTMGVDLVITRPFPPEQIIQNRATTPPLPPILDITSIAIDSTLRVTAVKAMTRVKTTLTKTAQIKALPDIHLQDAVIDYGGTTKVLVLASQDGDRYEPFIDNTSMKRARNGNGDDLSFNTDALLADTAIEVRVTRPNDQAGIAVEQFVTLLVVVRPNPDLTVTAADTAVPENGSTTISIENSQPEVNYQLTTNNTAVGNPVRGNGAIIELPTETLSAETTFAIRAEKVSDPTIFITLNQTVTIIIATP